MDLRSDQLRALLAAADKPVAPAGSTPLVRELPPWVERHAVVSQEPGESWLWCEASGPGGGAGGQMVLDLEEGRYLVDVFDAVTGRCVSLESAAAAPLVAGLSCPGKAVLVRVRRVRGRRIS